MLCCWKVIGWVRSTPGPVKHAFSLFAISRLPVIANESAVLTPYAVPVHYNQSKRRFAIY